MVLCIQSIKCSEFANNMLQNLHYCIPDHFRPLSTLMWSKNTFTRPWISLPSFLSTLYWDKTPWTGRSRLWTVVSCLVLCHGLGTRQTDDRKLIWGNLFIILYQIYPNLWGHRLSENVEFAYTTCLVICVFCYQKCRIPDEPPKWWWEGLHAVWIPCQRGAPYGEILYR